MLFHTGSDGAVVELWSVKGTVVAVNSSTSSRLRKMLDEKSPLWIGTRVANDTATVELPENTVAVIGFSMIPGKDASTILAL